MELNLDLIIKSIESLHTHIETIFTQSPLDENAIENIENILAKDFSMVGINGNTIKYEDAIQMFRQNAGKRPMLTIKTSNYKVLYQTKHLIAVTYQENHYENEKNLTRKSIVLMRRESYENPWQWYYLHETSALCN